MMKTLLVSAALAGVVMVTTALAQSEQHSNASLNSYVGYATPAQTAQATAVSTAPQTVRVTPSTFTGSSNPSLESFDPNAVAPTSTRFRTAPNMADNPDFDWIDSADIGA